MGYGYAVTRLAPVLPARAVADRFDAVDALRGLAVVWMTAYHLCYDLNHFGYLQQNFFRDPVWTLQRTAIVGLFLFTAGVAQALAVHTRQGWPRFWQRWAQVAGCALLVSLTSYWMFPRSFIYFGVLHALALMLIAVRLLAGARRWAPSAWLMLGLALMALPPLAALVLAQPAWADAAALFNSRALNWLGFITRKPVTQDYVPLLPWLGVMLWGMAAGQWLVRHRPAALRRLKIPVTRPLVWLGRWSLSWYMLHQPVLIGALMAVQALRG